MKPIILSLDPTSLEDVLEDILRVGRATDKEQRAEEVVGSLQLRIDRVREVVALSGTRPRVVCLEWLEPLMCAGHWVPEMIRIAGGEDCLGEPGKPSFKIRWEQVVEQNPDVVLVSPCGFDVRRGLGEIGMLTSREGWGTLSAAGKRQLFVVDANSYTSRSGPRLVDGTEIFAEIIHPELFSGLVPQGSVARAYS